MNRKNNDDVLREIQQSLARIESDMARLLSKIGEENLTKSNETSDASVLQPRPLNVERLTRNRRIPLPLPSALAKSVIGAFRALDRAGDQSTLAIPSDIDPKLVMESLAYLSVTYDKTRSYLVSVEGDTASILRTA